LIPSFAAGQIEIMSASGDFDVPPGQYPPFATVTDKDHAAWIIIATSLGLAWTLLFGAIRVFIRYTISPGLGIDDACLAVATVSTYLVLCPLSENLPLVCTLFFCGFWLTLITPEL
jgi:hypothetical protein